MDRRSADEIRRRIDEWERVRADCGADAGHGITAFINREIDRLRFELGARDRPMTFGRRASDPRPG